MIRFFISFLSLFANWSDEGDIFVPPPATQGGPVSPTMGRP